MNNRRVYLSKSNRNSVHCLSGQQLSETYLNLCCGRMLCLGIEGQSFELGQKRSKRSKVKEIIVLIKARSFLDELNLEHLTS